MDKVDNIGNIGTQANGVSDKVDTQTNKQTETQANRDFDRQTNRQTD